MTEEFIGVGPTREHLKRAIRAAFREDGSFDICHLHYLPGFEYGRFAKWVRDLHCKGRLAPGTHSAAQAYVVNFFLCPEATDELELEAVVQEVFPPGGCGAGLSWQPKIKIGSWALCRLERAK